MAREPKLPPTTAHVLGVFAKELEAEGFEPGRIDGLLVKALEYELKQETGLMVLDV